MGSVLSIVTLVLALIFILAEAGLGALRGTKKELCRIASLVVIGLLLFFLVPGIAKAIILAVANLVYPVGGSFTTMAGQIATELSLDAATVGSVIETVLALVASLLVPFVFVALFWLCKLISWPIFALVCFIIRKTKKAEVEDVVVPVEVAPIETVQDAPAVEVAATDEATVSEDAVTAEDAPETVATVTQETAPVSYVENRVVTKKAGLTATERLVGAAIGAFFGLFLGALTFMPLSQLTKSIETVGQETITELAGEEVAAAAGFWTKAPAGGIYRVTQLDKLFGLMYDSLAKMEIEDRVYYAKDLDEILVIVPDVIALMADLENADIQSLAAVAEPLKGVVKSVMDISLFADEDKMALVKYLAKTGLSDTASENELAAAALNGVESLSFAELENDVMGAIDLLVVLDKHGLLNIKDFNNLDFDIFSAAFIDESAEAIYRLNLAEDLLPSAIDMILTTALSEMSVVVVPCDPEVDNFADTKQDFKDLLSLMVDLVELAEDAEKLTTMSDVKAALNEVAKLKKSPFVSAQTYANLESALIKNTVSTAKVEETIQTAVKDHMEELKQNVDSDVEIDDETVEKVQEAVTEYLNDTENVKIEDVDNMITKLEDGTLMEGVDASVVEDIKSGNFNLADWMSKMNGADSGN